MKPDKLASDEVLRIIDTAYRYARAQIIINYWRNGLSITSNLLYSHCRICISTYDFDKLQKYCSWKRHSKEKHLLVEKGIYYEENVTLLRYVRCCK